ncbi:bis(5'-nucleosyl)-tetraphosphatase (symmetrical) YqeK [Anaerococcus murdochii]|uniref:bis(5'-nucleosyl)-tetraphosphatase (symmetrical) n=1 Tax=Anaerococcus murdochii TaxID=411577 RepID=A0ABS7T0X2_9FIRM|nr:bis(5'-nucleosyl)-tetraphosphatase (symmetrical) YqeK [Anaerococcus murdochii]MBZ2387403.1 bis(5'-nucleosyl)-tetraphosphatase (symmetrical) YqeK [Anaerococcus murdochii]
MNKMKDIQNKLINDIGEKRFKHSLRVAETAVKLADNYGLDPKKAYLAGLIHDCAKYNEEAYIKKYNIDFSIYPVCSIKDPVLHSFLGAEVAKKVYNICDRDVLKAIEYHTTGRPDMSDLEKIIFIADAIEPARDFEGIDKIRKLAFENLNKAMLNLLDSNIIFLIGKKALINPLSFEARNYLIEEKNGKIRHNS